MIKSELSNLKDEDKTFKVEIETEKLYKIVGTAERILEFNGQDQEGKGLKMLTTSQMLSGLPNTLTQLQAGNNSKKFKNEIRQLLYSLYRSKKLSKTTYNNLINTI